MNSAQKAVWRWQSIRAQEQLQGYVQAVDPRDALSRALTTDAGDGQMVGERHGIPVDVLAAAPGNTAIRYEVCDPGFKISVHKVACPSESRHPNDVVGCGSSNVSGPDEEGLFDCHDCGVFFNPLTANQA